MSTHEMKQALKEELGDGGQAFPGLNQPGMSLRDWFAGQALIGLLHNRPIDEDEQFKNEVREGLATEAYSIANYMIDELVNNHSAESPLDYMSDNDKADVLDEWKQRWKEKEQRKP